MALTEIDHLDREELMAECMDNCLEAVQACEWCASACIEEGEPEMVTCIQRCRDVADVASLHARLMARDSEFHAGVAGVCAEVCEACAEECEQFEAEHCQTCAEVVSRCADSCRRMATHG